MLFAEDSRYFGRYGMSMLGVGGVCEVYYRSF